MARDGIYGVCAVEPIAAEEVGGADTGMDKDPFEEAWDGVSGKALDPEMVKRARGEDMEEFRKHEVYEKVPISDCKQATGQMPIAVRWVDITKGDSANPAYRSILVAKKR